MGSINQHFYTPGKREGGREVQRQAWSIIIMPNELTFDGRGRQDPSRKYKITWQAFACRHLPAIGGTLIGSMMP